MLNIELCDHYISDISFCDNEYFVNFSYLHRSNGLIDKTLAAGDGFSRALAIPVFDSPWMYSFCGALTSLFYVLLVTFYFLLVFYCSLCSSLIFT